MRWAVPRAYPTDCADCERAATCRAPEEDELLLPRGRELGEGMNPRRRSSRFEPSVAAAAWERRLLWQDRLLESRRIFEEVLFQPFGKGLS